MAHIILLDDEARLLQTLARFLEKEGHQVTRGERFADVEQYLWPGRFEVLVTDIVMPDVSGMRVLDEVVGKRGCQEPVILITGEPNLETASQAVRSGAFDYLSKPVTKDRLLDAVSRGLRHVQLLRERDQARNNEMQLLRNLALLGESASVISHEVRTPITSLRQALRAVGEKIGVEDRMLVEELLTGLNRIERILSQTLSFAKPLQTHPRPTDVAELCRDSIAQVRSLPQCAGTHFAFEAEASLPEMHLDPVLFGEVFVNLLRNGCEACDGKGHVTVTLRARDGRLVIDVSDDGPGVPVALRNEIFRPFRTTKDEGTGIGLAFCRKVVEAHGGTIQLVEQPGPGACFRIDIPPAENWQSSRRSQHANA